MTLPVTIPNTFANKSSNIPLSELDTDFTVLADAINDINDGTNALLTPVLGNATATSLTASDAIRSSGTSGIGYSTGAGSTVTQSGNKSNNITINKTCGTITMNNAALAAGAEVSFEVSNSTVAATDCIIVNIASVGTVGAYMVGISAVSSGKFTITLTNLSTGSLSQALVLNFAVIKAVSA